MGSNLYATPPPKGSLEAQRVASCLLIERSHRRAGQSDIGPLTREYCFRATAGKKGRKKRQKKKKRTTHPRDKNALINSVSRPLRFDAYFNINSASQVSKLGIGGKIFHPLSSNVANGAPICGEEDRRSPENVCTFPGNVSTEQTSLSRRNNGDQSKEDGRESDIEIASWA